MLTEILNLEGVQTLNRKSLRLVNGGNEDCSCTGGGTDPNHNGGNPLCHMC